MSPINFDTFVKLNWIKSHIVFVLLILFGLNPVLYSFKNLNESKFSVILNDDFEKKEAEQDDDKPETDKLTTDLDLLYTISEFTDLKLFFHSSDFINLLHPQIEVVTPPPDFC